LFIFGNVLETILRFNPIDLGNPFCHPSGLTRGFSWHSLSGFETSPAGNIPNELQELIEMKNTISRLMRSLTKNEDGATAIEYGLIAGLIAIIIITGLTLLGTDLSNMFNQVANKL
jgi:pilus assembly protein Flp/PilA